MLRTKTHEFRMRRAMDIGYRMGIEAARPPKATETRFVSSYHFVDSRDVYLWHRFGPKTWIDHHPSLATDLLSREDREIITLRKEINQLKEKLEAKSKALYTYKEELESIRKVWGRSVGVW